MHTAHFKFKLCNLHAITFDVIMPVNIELLFLFKFTRGLKWEGLVPKSGKKHSTSDLPNRKHGCWCTMGTRRVCRTCSKACIFGVADMQATGGVAADITRHLERIRSIREPVGVPVPGRDPVGVVIVKIVNQSGRCRGKLSFRHAEIIHGKTRVSHARERLDDDLIHVAKVAPIPFSLVRSMLQGSPE